MKKLKEIKLQPGQKLLVIFVSAFVACAIIFAAVLGIVTATRRAGAAVSFSGITMDEKVASYFASYYKYIYVAELRGQGIDAYDHPEFWRETDENNIAYGTRLISGTMNFISDIVVANYYFERYATLSADEKKQLDGYSETILSRFNEDRLADVLDSCGIDKKTVRRAVEMHYKATRAKVEIYGTGGANLMGYPDECDRYLEEYSRVKLLFIRSEDTFVLDESGNKIMENGEYEMRDLTEEELADRAELIAKIDSEILGYENGADIQITEDLFESYIKIHGEGERDKTESGYYFSSASAYTVGFVSDVSADVVKAALEMEIGEYRKVDVGFATCYLYRCPVKEGAYVDTSEEGFFADFYSDAADFLFAQMVSLMREETIFSGKLTSDEIITVSYDSDLYIKF